MTEVVHPPAAPGAELHPALDLADSVLTGTGGQVLDLIDTPADATRWLVDRGLVPPDARLHEICATRVRALRQHVRALLTARIDRTLPPAEAVTAVNDALTRVPTAAPLRWVSSAGPYRVAPHPTDQVVDHALGVLAADAADLLTGPDADRLAACDSPPCTRFLLRNGRRHWCSIRCGDRARAARAYARRTQS
ncbi:CGNR zinc finger domain-containing protein [Actinoplanes aureus]|uniref:CGNR zinc finger domain-containing protein n=1 Tax=Actinoplanes aureus TaxID=2792083 RepID=A0A931CJB7_9ACTN|nr:CGNR zinc finger domain-containing protein [Actinoplanes aureus]MBG0568403.1 CGNR zinc finger domain-containing protein [Actinoplanes aureus]